MSWKAARIAAAASATMVALAGGAEAQSEEAAAETAESGPSATDPVDEPGRTTLEELEEKIRILAEEIADMQAEEAVPVEDITIDDGFSGLGPAASKVYRRDRGLSIGGYGDVRFRGFVNNKEDQTNIFDALRFVLYTGYKYNDWLVMNSEVEVEHGSTSGSGSVSLEFLTIDFLLHDMFNIRSGLLLIPMGFINEVHEPPFYFGAERPEVERRILPSTWRENGLGIFGTFDLGGGGDIHYRTYGVNGFDGTGFRDNGLRGGRQKGSEALSDHFAFVGRVDYEAGDLLPGLLVGGSVYAGNSGQNQNRDLEVSPGVTENFMVPDAFTHIYEFHVQYRGHGFSIRGLWAHSFIDDAGELSRVLGFGDGSSIARQMIGGYAEVGYNVLNFVDTTHSLEPFFRFEHLNTQYRVASDFAKDRSREYDLYVYGFSYKPIPQVVIKFDYRDFDARRGSLADEVQASIGFVF